MIIGKPIMLLGGGSASIRVSGNISSTDVVTATKGSVTKTGVYSVVGPHFKISDLDFGTWTVTWSNGTLTHTRTVVIDTATEYSVQHIDRLYLYNMGVDNPDITGGLQLFSTASSGTITKQSAQIESRFTRGNGIGTYTSFAEQVIVPTNKIDVTNYTKFCCRYKNNVYPRFVSYLYNTSGTVNPTNTSGSLREDLASLGVGTHTNGNYTDEKDISSVSGEQYLYVRPLCDAYNGGGDNISIDFYEIWLE